MWMAREFRPASARRLLTHQLQADLSVLITDGQFSTTPGAPISYTVTVSNAGPGTWNSLNLNMLIPNTI